MRSANASLELDDRFLAHVASCLPKTMGLERANAQVTLSRDSRWRRVAPVGMGRTGYSGRLRSPNDTIQPAAAKTA